MPRLVTSDQAGTSLGKRGIELTTTIASTKAYAMTTVSWESRSNDLGESLNEPAKLHNSPSIITIPRSELHVEG